MSLFGKPRYSTLKTAINVPHPSTPKKTKIPPGTFDQCKGCGGSVHKDEWKQNMNVCPLCGFHRQLPAFERIKLLIDDNTEFEETDSAMKSVDILKFEGAASYEEKLKKNREKTGLNDSVVCGTGMIKGIKTAIGVMDFRFLGASMGSVVGEKIARITELATKQKLPLMIVTASGGARMYEGMFSLMQMAKTSGALERHKEARLPYIVLMTHPTTAGVSASFATLGDLILAEPKALIGFAGPRVIKDTTQATLPEGFQLSEFLLRKGLIDRIIHRKELKHEIGVILQYLTVKKTKK
ncbi:MAG: acetyl-CoA carboxylase, carboxyltransferase subunit beta [Victivallales bacterium]|nr:acetyl-CoA carboxylase, carboxyltransferase subunit beta [Victivallales bacterium]MCF7889494.1 acetyl-CoA carboxylase, carboxyltransferase subunit beta [Victivallales bacterium]